MNPKNNNFKIVRLGTALYMAPELFEGGNYDFSADIYSLSVTIWEILYRRYGILFFYLV